MIQVKDLPKRIQKLIESESVCAHGVFLSESINFHDSADGVDFWFSISKGCFEPFYKKYGFDGDIKNFPYEVVMAMCDEQVKQGNKWSVEVFEDSIMHSKLGGGFSWGSTVDGYDFWNSVIRCGEYDLIQV